VFQGRDDENIAEGVEGKSAVSSATGQQSARDNIVVFTGHRMKTNTTMN
jgi:hypothetical protein